MIFGPVLSVIPFKSVEDGLRQRANATTYGLAARLVTRDGVCKALKAGNAPSRPKQCG